MKGYAISYDDILEINNPDTILDAVSDGNKVIAYMRKSEPYNIIFPLDREILDRVLEQGVPGFFDFGDFGILHLKYGDKRFVGIVSPSIIIILDRKSSYPNFPSIFAALVDEIGKFVIEMGDIDNEDYQSLGQKRREIHNDITAIEDMYRVYIGAFTPQEASFLFSIINRMKNLLYQIDDRRDMLRINMLKPVRDNTIPALLIGIMLLLITTKLPTPLAIPLSIVTLVVSIGIAFKFKNP